MSPLMCAAPHFRRLHLLLSVACLVGVLLSPTLLALPIVAQATPPEPAVPPVFTPLTATSAGAFFDTRMRAWLDQYHIAGATVAVVQDGAVIFTRGYGLADVATGAPVQPDATLFHVGSLTKLFTWTAVMQLVEQGELDLHADVNTYLDFTLPATYAQPITLWHLLTHTAGFENRNFGYGAASPEQIQGLAAWLPTHIPARVRPPGVAAAYSNYGPALAGYIVARVGGMSYEEYVEQHIFQPLGMTHSSVRTVPPAALQASTSRGYTYDSATGRFVPVAPPLFEVGPAGSVTSTAEDMARFMLAHLGTAPSGTAPSGPAPSGPAPSGAASSAARLLAPATLAAMHTTAFRAIPYGAAQESATGPSVPPIPGMALGFFDLSRHGEHIVGHVGAALPTFHSLLALLPARNTGFFVSFNSAGAQPLTTGASAILLRDFADHFLPLPPTDQLSGGAAGQPAASNHMPTLSPADAAARTAAYQAAYAGAYRFANNPTSSTTTLEKSVELLAPPVTLSAPGDGTLHLVDAWGEKRFIEVSPFYFREVDDAGVFSDDILVFTAFSGTQSGSPAGAAGDAAPRQPLPSAVQAAGSTPGTATAFALGSRSSQVFARLPWYATPAVAQGLLAASVLLLLTVVAAPLLAALGGRLAAAKRPHARRQAGARRLVFAAAMLNLLFVLGFAAIMLLAPTSIALGQVALLGALLTLPVAALLLALGSLPTLWWAWREGWWGLPARVHYTTAVAALFAFAVLLHQWNLLGWRF